MLVRFLGKLLYTFIVVIQFIVSLRFVFTLIGANPESHIVTVVYELSEKVVGPFHGIVHSPVKFLSFTVDLDSLIVIFVCMLAGYVTMEIIKIFSSRKEE